MNATDLYRNIATTATPAQIEQATQWYADAELLAHDLIRIYQSRNINVTVENTASIISAFSPRQRWSRNMAQALEFAHGGKPAGLKNNLLMAENSLTMGFDALKGQKTNAFAKAIAGDENAVVIDVWMLRAVGIEKKSPTQSQYKVLADAVTATATMYGMTPRSMQALIWIIVRGNAS